MYMNLEKLIRGSIILLLLASSCGGGSDHEAPSALSPDELYLIDTYEKIINAQQLYTTDSLMAVSQFTAIDSTTDTLRIANTINKLNSTPDRWVALFKFINERLKKPAAGSRLENSGSGSGTSADIHDHNKNH